MNQIEVYVVIISDFTCAANHTCICTCTLSVKRNLSLLQSHSLKSKATKLIIFGHRLGKFILNKHIKKPRRLLQSKRR